MGCEPRLYLEYALGGLTASAGTGTTANPFSDMMMRSLAFGGLGETVFEPERTRTHRPATPPDEAVEPVRLLLLAQSDSAARGAHGRTGRPLCRQGNHEPVVSREVEAIVRAELVRRVLVREAGRAAPPVLTTAFVDFRVR